MAAPRSYLVHEDRTPAQARYPAIDAHNHLWAAWETVDKVVEVMDETGVSCYCDLTANIELQWIEGGYAFRPGDIGNFFRTTAARHPGRFYGFTTATFSRPPRRAAVHGCACLRRRDHPDAAQPRAARRQGA